VEWNPPNLFFVSRNSEKKRAASQRPLTQQLLAPVPSRLCRANQTEPAGWEILVAAANKQVTIESLIAEAEAARAKAMSEKGGAAAAVSALTAKAKLAGMWREKVDQHNTGNPVYERIERVIVERPPPSVPESIPDESIYDEPSTEVAREMPRRHWSAD
jgi:hypothetical protein